MIERRFTLLAFVLIGLVGTATSAAFADQTGSTLDAPKKAKTQKRHPLVTVKPTPAEQYDAPLELNFDPMKSVILKAEPAIPYQPQTPSKPQSAADAGNDVGQAHLAPLLRESSIPESFGDRGSFIDRHEFGIQLHDHF